MPELDAAKRERFRRAPSERVRVSVQADPAASIVAFDPDAIDRATDAANAKDFWF